MDCAAQVWQALIPRKSKPNILDAGLGLVTTCSEEEVNPKTIINNLTQYFFNNETTLEEIEQIESKMSPVTPCQINESRKVG